MANSYTYVADLRVTVKTPTKASEMNRALINVDHAVEALNILIDSDDALGMKGSIADPVKIKVDATTTWSAGWWEDSGGGWWYLVHTADVASFTRAQATFYIPTGSINDVPAS